VSALQQWTTTKRVPLSSIYQSYKSCRYIQKISIGAENINDDDDDGLTTERKMKLRKTS